MPYKSGVHLIVLVTVILMGLLPLGSVEAQCYPRNDWTGSYTIARGDTLNRIARRYGLTTEQLAQGNCIININRIYVGQALRVPAGTNGNNGGGNVVRTMDWEIWVYGAANPNSQVRTIIRAENVTLFYRSTDSLWIYIRTSGGVVGWIQTYQLAITNSNLITALPINNNPEGASEVQIIDSGVRLRAAPGTHTRILAQLSWEPVTLLGRSYDGSWLKVRTRDNRVGWVYRQYVGVTQDSVNGLPVETY